MRTSKFKTVLWNVARKAGFSPESGNFLSNQAIPVGEYINDWVQRLYAQEDWPEWTKIIRVTPNSNHVVPWTYVIQNNDTVNDPDISILQLNGIGRVLAVYLINPALYRNPMQTKFQLLEDGIHCGFEHGTYVWIKYMEPPPTFTAATWRSDFTYDRFDAVYSPTTGECYKSLVNNNTNHDPALNRSPSPVLTIEEIQTLVPTDPGLPDQPQIVDVYGESSDTPIPDPLPADTSLSLGLFDTSGTPIAAHSGDGPGSIADALLALKTQFDLDALPGFTFTIIGSKLRIESATTEFVIGFWNYTFLNGFTVATFVQVQPFATGMSGTSAVPQQLKLTIGDNAFIPGALYTISITDLDGIEHVVEYQSSKFDNRLQILNGLLLGIGTSTVPEVQTIGTALNTSEPSATLSLLRGLGVSAAVQPPASQYWSLVPFPDALVQPVVRGASAALMAEWGQTATATGEEAKVAQETDMSRGDFETTPVPQLTTQQKALSRYRIQ